jgi:hypothetical protein
MVSFFSVCDLQDDGPNPQYREQRFGTVENAYLNASLPHAPKPSFLAARNLQQLLGHCTFAQRLSPINSTFADLTFILSFSCTRISTQQPSTNDGDSLYALFFVFWTLVESGTGSCALADVDKEDCGFYGISKDQCEARGCCFQDPFVSGPQCYHHSPRGPVPLQVRTVPGRCFNVVDVLGESQVPVCSGADGVLTVDASDSPVYVFTLQ